MPVNPCFVAQTLSQPERLKQDSPGQRPGLRAAENQALNGRNKMFSTTLTRIRNDDRPGGSLKRHGAFEISHTPENPHPLLITPSSVTEVLMQ